MLPLNALYAVGSAATSFDAPYPQHADERPTTCIRRSESVTPSNLAKQDICDTITTWFEKELSNGKQMAKNEIGTEVDVVVA